MNYYVNISWSKCAIVFVSLIFFSGCAQEKTVVSDYSGDIVASWNERIMATAVDEDKLLTLKGLRSTAMMSIAIHDALNTIHPVYSRYAFSGETRDADPMAAAAQAAFEIAVDQYPDKRADMAAELNIWLNDIEESPAKTAGIELGKATAATILELRKSDGWNGEAEYQWHPMGPGVYAEFNEHSGTPEGFVFGAGWAVAKPFMLKSPDQFRSLPPLEITSDAYTKAFDEVKEVGRNDSKTRTADQAHFAMWWKDFVENSHNRLARDLTMKAHLNLWKTARMFALLNMSIYDAYINVFDNKFFYNHWRPYTAIRWAENDGNPDTEPETDWNNLHKHTYAFPSYPSAHGCASAAAMSALANTFGDAYAFTMTTKMVDESGPFSPKIEMHPPTRSFTSFSSAAMECSMSRVYLGIHFRYDSVEGNRLGTTIGNYAIDNFLKPVE